VTFENLGRRRPQESLCHRLHTGAGVLPRKRVREVPDEPEQPRAIVHADAGGRFIGKVAEGSKKAVAAHDASEISVDPTGHDDLDVHVRDATRQGARTRRDADDGIAVATAASRAALMPLRGPGGLAKR